MKLSRPSSLFRSFSGSSSRRCVESTSTPTPTPSSSSAAAAAAAASTTPTSMTTSKKSLASLQAMRSRSKSKSRSRNDTGSTVDTDTIITDNGTLSTFFSEEGDATETMNISSSCNHNTHSNNHNNSTAKVLGHDSKSSCYDSSSSSSVSASASASVISSSNCCNDSTSTTAEEAATATTTTTPKSRTITIGNSIASLDALWEDLCSKKKKVTTAIATGTGTTPATTSSNSSSFASLTSITISIKINPIVANSKSIQQHLEEVFVALGSLPKLQEIIFQDSTLYVPNVCKFLHSKLKTSSSNNNNNKSSKKKTSVPLRTIKFRSCTFIGNPKYNTASSSLSSSSSSNNNNTGNNNKSMTKLWSCLQEHSSLQTLEITNSFIDKNQYHKSSTRNINAIHKYTYDMTSTIMMLSSANTLQHLVLEGCILPLNPLHVFASLLLSYHTNLQELELICPEFDTHSTTTTTTTRGEASTTKKHPYVLKQQAIRKLLSQTIPTVLSDKNNNNNNNINNTNTTAACTRTSLLVPTFSSTATSQTSSLKKLNITLEEHHYTKLYECTMLKWIELVQYNNHSLIDLQLKCCNSNNTSLSSPSTSLSTSPSSSQVLDSYLHCALQYYLRLNEVLNVKHDEKFHSNGQINKRMIISNKEEHKELLQQHPDIACLYNIVKKKTPAAVSCNSSIGSNGSGSGNNGSGSGSGRNGNRNGNRNHYTNNSNNCLDVTSTHSLPC